MLLKRLFGRRAETKDPDAQQTPVATALESNQVSVRRDACRRLTDLRRLRDLADTDKDAGVRDLAEARYRRLLCGLDANAPSLDARLAELNRSANPGVLEQAATQASDPQLRLAAIEQLGDESILANCATNDLVAGNRLAAAQRVQQKQGLEQIVMAIGKRDKRVYRLARERLKHLIELEERPQRAQELGESLCERLERLGRFDNWLQDRAVLGHLEQQWETIEDDANQSLRERFQGLRQRFLDDYEAYLAEHAAQQTAQQTGVVADSDGQALIEQLRALTRRASGLDMSALEREQERFAATRRAAESSLGPGAAALEQAYLEAEKALAAQRRELQRRAQADQTAAQLLVDLRRHHERSAVPNRRTIESLRKRRRSLPSSPPSAQAAPVKPVATGISNSAKIISGEQVIPASADDAANAALQSQPQMGTLQEIDQLLERLERRLERHLKQLLRKLESLPERLTELERHLNQGELKKADPLYQSISATLDHGRTAGVGREILTAADERLKRIAPQLRDLRQWRRWSTDEHREQICTQIEALAADTQHADEPSINRLEELKGQWQMLDRQGAPAADALWERFRQAAELIRERCQPYLEAQSALLSENRKQREALAKQLEDFLAKVDWQRVDWKKLHRAEREMRQAWSRLVEAPGGDKHSARDRAIEGRFRRSLRRLDHTLAEERERNQAEKQQLLEQMRALAEEPDLRRAIDTAKQLQRQWHTTVPARHRDENALWQKFRSASDAVFARRAAESEARGASLRENQATREAICEALLALTDAQPMLSAERLEQEIGELKTRWSDTEALPVPRQAQAGLNRRWREALAAAEGQLTNTLEAARWARLERLAQRAAYCDTAGRRLCSAGTGPTVGAVDNPPDAEDATAQDCERLQQDWNLLPTLEDSELEAALEQTFSKVLGSCNEPSQRGALRSLLEDNLARRESLCLNLEIITQVDSPDRLQSERMQRQVERLRDRMAAGESSAGEDIDALLRDWYLSCPAAASATLDTRFERVKQALRDAAAHQDVSLQALNTSPSTRRVGSGVG